MTHQEQLSSLFTELKVPFEEVQYEMAGAIILTAKDGTSVTGYNDSFLEFKFNESGTFFHVGIYPRADHTPAVAAKVKVKKKKSYAAPAVAKKPEPDNDLEILANQFEAFKKGK